MSCPSIALLRRDGRMGRGERNGEGQGGGGSPRMRMTADIHSPTIWLIDRQVGCWRLPPGGRLRSISIVLLRRARLGSK